MPLQKSLRAQILALLGGSLALILITALACGFASASHFSNRFRQALGATPRQYRAAFL